MQKLEFITKYLQAEGSNKCDRMVSMSLWNRLSNLNISEMINMVEDFPKFKKAHNNHKLILYCRIILMLGLVVAAVIVTLPQTKVP